MLAHLVVVGLYALFVLSLSSPPGAALGTLILKTLIGVAWFGVGLAGIIAWREHRWSVAAVPVVSLVLIWILAFTGESSFGWALGLAY